MKVVYPVVLMVLLTVASFVVLARALRPPRRLNAARVYGGNSGLGGYFHPGQPTTLRSILMMALAVALVFTESLDGDQSRYLALQSEVAWIKEVALGQASLAAQSQPGSLGSALLDPLFLDRFPGLVERAGEGSAVLSDGNQFSLRSIYQLLQLFLFVLLFSAVLALLQAAAATAHARGAHFALPVLYVAAVSVVFFSIIFTLLGVGSTSVKYLN